MEKRSVILKEITYSQFKQAIRTSFENDGDIKSLYDPSVCIKCIDDIVEDIYEKVVGYKLYKGEISIKGAYENGDLVGYVVKFNDLLVSFALSISYRTKEKTKEFFELIKKDFNCPFYCYLWEVNKRAVRFLERNGLKQVFSGNKIIKLQCL